ncbi:hypothetical protein AB0M44_35800 [Streptosporangium subroseum]|uniref:hypothetical protein n=1 Tax=Streptosporangium subroseum TaxID=106412 RepID=UPI0034221ECF
MNRSPAAVTGLAICALLGVLDLVGLAGLGMDDGPPAAVVLGGGALGAITLAAVIATWRGSHGGLPTVIASRVIAALLGVPVFFTDQAPGWARIVVAIAIFATAVGIGLLAAARRRSTSGISRTS